MRFKYNGIKEAYVAGDIHGDFDKLIRKIKHDKIEDSLIIVAGDCGFGFEERIYYDNTYKYCGPSLEKHNNIVLFMRGNHDDPSYFSEDPLTRFFYDRMQCVPDYSVITINGSRNLLCIGGALSVDRKLRKENVSWWAGESAVKNDEEIDKLTAEGTEIDTVIAHNCPSFCEPTEKKSLHYFSMLDENILEDCDMERKMFDDILTKITTSQSGLRNWLYGHYHKSWEKEISGITFTMLSIMELKKIM